MPINIAQPERRNYGTQLIDAVQSISEQYFPNQGRHNPDAWRAFTLRNHNDGSKTLRIIATDREDGPASTTITMMPDGQLSRTNHLGVETNYPLQPSHSEIFDQIKTWAIQTIAARIAEKPEGKDLIYHAAQTAHLIDQAADRLISDQINHCTIENTTRALQLTNLTRRIGRQIRDNFTDRETRRDVNRLFFKSHHHTDLRCLCGTFRMHNNALRNRDVLNTLSKTDPWALQYYTHIIVHDEHRQHDTFDNPGQIVALVKRHLGVTERQFALRPYSSRANSITQPNDQIERNKPRFDQVRSNYRKDVVMKLITLEQLLDPPEDLTEEINTPSFFYQLSNHTNAYRAARPSMQEVKQVSDQIPDTINQKHRVAILERFVRQAQQPAQSEQTIDVQAFIDEQMTLQNKQNRQKNR